jgi:GNAT superfamily N-acetyltransferase
MGTDAGEPKESRPAGRDGSSRPNFLRPFRRPPGYGFMRESTVHPDFRSMAVQPVPQENSVPTLVRITRIQDAARLDYRDLSDFFNPFLGRFIRDALRGAGEVWVSMDGTEVNGVLLYNDVERVGSIFSRDPLVVETLFKLKEGVTVFAETPLGAKPETFQIYAVDLPAGITTHRFSHPVRRARPSEQTAVFRILNEMYGRIDIRGLPPISTESDPCFVVEVAGELVGAGWVTLQGTHARLHSLTVRPRYRRIGIGTDLWHARVRWAAQAGARQVISEISEHNAPSQAIAARGGMRPIGRMFLAHRPVAGPPGLSVDRSAAVRANLVRHID